ncbi:MAG: hypothetical protein M0R03_13105 [Novosphingobium sp.]|nr:hypothetical protein [Novosphingobium sp.]
MILVKDIIVENVNGDCCDVAYYPKRDFDRYSVKPIDVKMEHITGKFFINERDEEVCLGFAKHVQDILGLPFEAFDNMNKKAQKDAKLISSLRKLRNKEYDELNKYKKMSFWNRLKFLFIGGR